MKIGIIIYSHTGNTKSVALKLKDKLSSAGHSVKMESITVNADYKPGQDEFRFKVKPEVDRYDALVFGAPVWAFSLATVMRRYLMQTASLKNKKIACFVTQFFPFSWLGGKRACAQMKKICEAKGSRILSSGIVNWAGEKRRGKKIDGIVERISICFNPLSQT
jgi:flavodoxin